MYLSIIIPTYNRSDLIRYTLDSLNKRYHKTTDLEIIVIDDGSSDNTEELIDRDYPEVKFLKNTGKGASAARNMGLAAATGKYILYLDSDDLVGENYFEAKIAFLESHPDVDACYGAYEYFQSDGAFTQESIMFKHKYPLILSEHQSNEHVIHYLSGNFLPQNTFIWRRAFLLRLEGHDEALGVNQDVELVIRALFNGLKLMAIDDGTKVYIRNHSLDIRVGDPANAKKKWLQILQLRKKIFKDLKVYGYDGSVYYRALSTYLFGYWKLLRHSDPEMALEYLNTAREISWPVPIKGNILYRSLAATLGPVNAVKIKYFLLKRD